MNEMTLAPTAAALALLAGMALGGIFFGGLWYTVRRCVTSRRPALLLLGSLALRMGITLGGFYLVAGGRWQSLLACLLGFVLARLLATRLTRPPRAAPGLPNRESGHAS